MILSINQPAYLPWLGYFHRIAVSDHHVVLDHVQFEKNSYTNRNRVVCGSACAWLTVPVKTAQRFGELPISSLEIDDRRSWRTKHWRTISQQYRKTPFFAEHEPAFKQAYEREWTHLAPLCEHLTGYLLRQFGIRTRLTRSSDLNLKETKSNLVLEICRRLGATTYVSGALGKRYLRESDFQDAGIQVLFQDYRHPVYPQSGKAFQPNLAAIDLLFHCGPDSRSILLAGQDLQPA